jgi:hypothetical protein
VQLSPIPIIRHFLIILLSEKKIFPSKKDITVGDVVVLNNNNYHSYAFGLYNGDIAQVVTVSTETETQSAPVFITEGTNKVRKT